MGFFSDLFGGRNKPKMIEAPKMENVKKENDTVQQMSDSNQAVHKEFDNNRKETIVFQIDKSLESYKEWYAESQHNEQEKYGGAIDIVGVKDGTDIVLLNCQTGGNKEDKIVLAIVNIPGENRTEKLKFLRQKIDLMLCAQYSQESNSNNVELKKYLQVLMSEIKNKIFDIEFTNEGEYLLLDGNKKLCLLERTVSIDIDYEGDRKIIHDYKKKSNTFELPESAYAGAYTTVITTPVLKMDMNQAKYKKEHYIRDLQKLGEIAGKVGLLKNKRMSKDPTTTEYNNSLRDGLIMLKNSKYAKSVAEIKTMDDLKCNAALIIECIRNLIGDSYSYYENIAEEVVYDKANYSNMRVDKNILSDTLYLSKQVQNERAEYLKAKSEDINKKIQTMAKEAVENVNQELIQSRLNKAKNEDMQLSNSKQLNKFRTEMKVPKEELNPMHNTTEQSNPKREKEESGISHN